MTRISINEIVHREIITGSTSGRFQNEMDNVKHGKWKIHSLRISPNAYDNQ